MSNESEADEAEQDAEAETESEEADGLQRGDFISLDYTARTVEGDQLVDTTDPEVAEEEGVGEDEEFSPRTIVLGEEHIFGTVEEDILGKDVGDTGTVTVAAGDAFGAFDDDEVRTVSADKIPEDDRYPGAHVDIDGQHGHVETIIGGRARVDFNHPLAGEDIEYDYEILEEVTDREEQASALLSVFLDMELDVWFETETVEEEQLVETGDDDEGDEDDEESEPEYVTVEVQQETLYIEATPQLSMNQQWMMGKQQIAQQLTQLLEVDRIIVQEELGGGPMGGMGGMMGGGMGGMEGVEEALEDEDIDADEIVEELENAGE